MVSPLYTGYTTSAPDPDAVRHGVILDWLLRNKAEATARGEKTGLLNQALTADNYGPPMPPIPSSVSAPSSAEYEKIKAYSSQPIQGAPALPPVVRNKTMPVANTSVAASKPSGVEQEAQSKSALNDLMAQLAAHRQISPEEQRQQMLLNFFGAMAKSNSPTLMGSIGEGAGTIAPTVQAQTNARIAGQEKSLEDQIKMAQYEQDYGLKERAVGADEMRARATDRLYGARAGAVGSSGSSIGTMAKLQGLALRLNTAIANEMDPVRKQALMEDAAAVRQQLEIARGGAGEGVSAAGGEDPLGLR